MNLRTNAELLAAALTETCVDVYVEESREVSGIIAKFTPLSICVKDAANPSESAYYWREKCTIVVTEVA